MPPLVPPEPMPPLVLPEPMPPLEPVLGEVLGEAGELPVPLLVPLPLPVAPAPELDLLKWASHSEREI